MPSIRETVLTTMVGIILVFAVMGMIFSRQDKELGAQERSDEIILYTEKVGDLERYYDPELKVVCYKNLYSTNQHLSCVKL